MSETAAPEQFVAFMAKHGWVVAVGSKPEIRKSVRLTDGQLVGWGVPFDETMMDVAAEDGWTLLVEEAERGLRKAVRQDS